MGKIKFEGIYDIVNENDEVIDKAKYSEVYSKKLLHRIVHVFVFNSKGELFIQKRSQRVIEYPGYYTSSASGMVPIGEDYLNTAKKELKEELGMESDLDFLFKVRVKKPYNRFLAVFKTIYDGELSISVDEVSGGKFLSIKKIKNQMQNKKMKFTPGFKAAFNEYLKRFDNEWD
jgi:isopentenyldiphosphate isomerase